MELAEDIDCKYRFATKIKIMPFKRIDFIRQLILEQDNNFEYFGYNVSYDRNEMT